MALRARFYSTKALLALLGTALLTAAPQCAIDDPDAGRLYVLEEGSALSEGCFEGPCLCPVSLGEVIGSFRLKELPTLAPGPNRLFALNDLSARAGSGLGARRIRGEGLYQNDPVSRTQALDLQLRIDGGVPQSLASGRVADQAGFPEIEIEVREGGLCFDTRLQLRALPADLICETNAECAADAYCRTPPGRCDARGLCMPRGDACPAVVDPVCGCDGTTYGNACEAGRAGIAVAADGPCFAP